MTLEMFSGLLIVFSIIFVLTLPFNYLFLRFIRELLKLLKELKADYKRIAAEMDEQEAEYMEENLAVYLQKQQEKQEKGTFRYYTLNIQSKCNKR
ncbi:MAG: hypothetical protein IKU46_03030 [Peptococcaceae bacterium]|nr:hypothetical protein [Peptococcaceae bacterium]